MTCEHVHQIRDVEPSTNMGCEECLKTGQEWVALRMCLVCGHVGCCDSSEGQHATAHFHETQHPVMQAIGEQHWGWCYADQKQLPEREVVEAMQRREQEARI